MEKFPSSFLQNVESKENETEKHQIKEGVDFVFEQNPELFSIGNKEQYSKYLESIFSNSKIKSILYHEGNAGITKFDNTKYNKSLGRDEIEKRYGLGHYFADDINYASGFGEQMYSVLLNMEAPKTLEIGNSNNDYENVANINQSELDQLRSEGYDSIIGVAAESIEDKNAYPNEYIVFEPEQVHILGSKEDLAQFTAFVKEKL